MINHKLLSKKTTDLFWTAQETKQGKKSTYGFGWRITENIDPQIKEERLVSHGGAAVGASSYILLLPNNKLVIAIIANLGDVNLEATTIEIAKVWQDYLNKERTTEDTQGREPVAHTR